MDRILPKQKSKLTLFKSFEYLDLFPYSIAVLMLCGEVYILLAFIKLFAHKAG